MHIFDVRQNLQNGKTIFDLPLRVAYYARVSTSSDDQINSLDNQISFFEDYICRNRNWEFVEGYVDEGISGTSALKREDFQRMFSDSRRGKFDLLITKEISRFARSTIDSIQYTQQMLQNSVGVYFLNDGINTFEPDSELRLTIMSSLVQEEVRKLSSRVKFGYKESIKKGRVLGNDSIWGYEKDDGRLKIVESEANMVRLIFDLYISGVGLNSICDKLYSLGYRNHSNNKFTYNTVKSIIQNPKYKGYYAGRKTEKIDYRYGKRIKFDKKDWVLYKASDEVVPQIVDEKVWETANEILKNRKEKYSGGDNTRYQDKTIYSGKIICAKHKTGYWRSIFKYKSGNREVWQCSVYKKGGKKDCDNPQLYLEDIEDILKKIIDGIFVSKNDIINQLIAIYKNVIEDENFEADIENAQNEINVIKKRKDKLLDLFMADGISKNEFTVRNEEMNSDIAVIEKRIKSFEIKREERNNQGNEFKVVEKTINEILEFGGSQRLGYQKLISTLLDKIEVSSYNQDGEVPLSIYFKTGVTLETKFDFGNLKTENNRYQLAVGFN